MSTYQPRVGDPYVDPYKRTCGFALDRSSPTCDAPAAVHLVVSYGPGDQQLAMLAACEMHVRIARVAGNLVMEHPFADTCNMPGTRWDFRNNRCVLDDSGRSRAAHIDVAVCA